MDKKILTMTASWPWNPNHRYRFYVMGEDLVARWLFTVRFSNRDQSIYITPLYEKEYAVQSLEWEERTLFHHRPGADFHLSLHESGVVNVTTSDKRARLRHQVNVRADVRHVVTFQINSITNLPIAPLDEINSPRGGHLHLPIVGFPNAPLMLTVYCSKKDTEWTAPALGNSMMMHYKTEMKGKSYNFSFVQWQDLNMSRGEGDIALQFGGENDTFYGV